MIAKRTWILLIVLPIAVLLVACPNRRLSSNQIAPEVAEENTGLAATTADADSGTDSEADNPIGEEATQIEKAPQTSTATKLTAATPTPIPTAPPGPPPPTPTQIIVVQLPVPGAPNLVRNTGSDFVGLNILLPGFAPHETTNPMIFQDRIGMSLSIYAINAPSQVAGAGIRQVIFTITDLKTDEIVYERVERSSLYCLFGGNTMQECWPRTFAQLNYQWPNGMPIYNGEYDVELYIETDDDSGTWNLPIIIQGAQERPRGAGGGYGGA
ncbi:MAG: hypothetical protein AAF702_26045 [Chloroflexota bacterium]